MSAGPFTGDAALVLEEAFINGGGIETPARSQQGNFFDVGGDSVLHAEGKWLRGIGIIETFEA